MIRYLKLRAWFCLFLVLLITLAQPLAVFADVTTSSNAFVVNPDYLIGSASNANPYGISTMELSDEDYYIQPFSSVGSVSNTINGPITVIAFYSNGEGVNTSLSQTVYLKDGYFDFAILDSQLGSQYSDCFLTSWEVWLNKNTLPVPGSYNVSFDFSSDFSVVDYTGMSLTCIKDTNNASTSTTYIDITNKIQQAYGDIYLPPMSINLTNVNNIVLVVDSPISHGYRNVAGSLRFNFTPISSGDYPSTGPDLSGSEYEADVSGSLSNISSSMDSAAESLEYISTSQNLIIQGIDNVIMHISDQLYAFWDQLYNLIHLPQMAKMDEIIAAIRKVANDVDMSQVVGTIEDTTAQQIANDNANTSKVEQSVEKHGNFIIDGLKGLFIPSDEYFKTYFDDLYEYFSDRFGFLSFPIDLLSRLIDLFVNNSDVDCVLTLPGLEVSGEQVWTEQLFNLTEFMETNFPFVLTAIRTVTSIGLIMAFVNLCSDKWNEVMKN